MQNAHREDVLPALLGVLPPVKGLVSFPECVVRTDHDDLANLAQETLLDHLADVIVLHQAERARDDLLHQVGMAVGRLAHAVRFLRIAGHAGFGEDVLVGVERRHDDLAVQVGPSPDEDGVDFGIVDERPPIGIDAGDVKFLGRGPTTQACC